MPKTVAILQGHPDPAGGHLCHALADAYAEGAAAAGHRVLRVEIAQLDVPVGPGLVAERTGAHPSHPQGPPLAETAIDHLPH